MALRFEKRFHGQVEESLMKKKGGLNMLISTGAHEEKILLKLRELPKQKRVEVLDFIDFLRVSQTSSKREKEGEEYSYYLTTLRKKIRDRGGLRLGRTQEERLQKLRRIRDLVWKEDYENHFGHQ